MKTPKPPQKEPELDYTDVEGVEDLLKTRKANAEASKTPKLTKALIQVCATENVEKRGTPEKSPEIDEEEFLKSPPAEIPESLPAEQVQTDVEIEEELLDETVVQSPKKSPESAVDEEELVESPVDEKPDSPTTEEEESCPKASSPQADYTAVRGVKQLLQTPKPPPVTPKADYSDVSGIRRLMKDSADYTDVGEETAKVEETPLRSGRKGRQELPHRNPNREGRNCRSPKWNWKKKKRKWILSRTKAKRQKIKKRHVEVENRRRPLQSPDRNRTSRKWKSLLRFRQLLLSKRKVLRWLKKPSVLQVRRQRPRPRRTHRNLVRNEDKFLKFPFWKLCQNLPSLLSWKKLRQKWKKKSRDGEAELHTHRNRGRNEESRKKKKLR